MYYLCFFILIISFLTGRAAPVACSEVFPWIAPKSLTVLGSPFVDVILETPKEFIEKCDVKVGEIQNINSSDVKKIFLMYRETFPDNPITVTRKEPLSLTEDQLANLGCRSLLNKPPYLNYSKQAEYGPALNAWDHLRLILRCPNQEDTFCYFLDETPQSLAGLSLSPDLGYTLIDSELLIYGCYIESFLKKAGSLNHKILLDLNNPHIVHQYRDRVWSLFPYIDVLFLSEESTQSLTGMSNTILGRRLLSRMIPTVFVQNIAEEKSQIYFIQHGKETLYSSTQELQQIIFAFLFGYINDNVMDYCFHAGDLLLENA
ncbi:MULTISPECIES: carbohydrate kinase family protein [Chlamydia]|uniref:Exported protein n=2 Tax=Chlamydia TaxID=810 RepID=A0ABP2X3S0_CHLPS|nr:MULTISPECIES: hypothetical protein [Chlamydia]AFS19194.1 putative exported protein [Chlamydia psittaci 84/55]AFS22392.1 putative exported protein [Chlamydia psittaci VS225]AGE74772.1 hypothetical protein AO9_01015 [Chlamydia psittaci Mat116]EPJ16020.1 putative exported protein [Chlamydia psittaci 02DC18]EPJ17260.1 putative exported protein [Chlamydia psittaci 02DC22]EPJ19877.1 putative exported protein [Chlamydia psittaci 02DC23]EPJ99066.1 putative exported protein [Chlamydia psittaci 02D